MAEILPATLNHEAFDLGIASESHQKAVGINGGECKIPENHPGKNCESWRMLDYRRLTGYLSGPVGYDQTKTQHIRDQHFQQQYFSEYIQLVY